MDKLGRLTEQVYPRRLKRVEYLEPVSLWIVVRLLKLTMAMNAKTSPTVSCQPRITCFQLDLLTIEISNAKQLPSRSEA